MKTSNESGSHLIVVALGILFVGVLAFAGYRVYQMQMASNGASDTTASVTVPAKITNTASLTQTANALDASSSQLNSNLDDTSLDSDLNAML